MPLGLLLRAITRSGWGSSRAQPVQNIAITCRGIPINRDDLLNYTNGRFLIDEEKACRRRFVQFDVDQLCAVAASAGGHHSPVKAIEKMEGGFSKAMLLQKEDGSEVIAKIPFSITGPPKYTTASEVAVLKYLHAHTKIPVPKVLAWSSDASNPIGAEYIIMEKASGTQLFNKWGEMSEHDKFLFVKQITKLEGEMAAIRFPASGNLYLCEDMTGDDAYVSLSPETDPSGQFCIGPSCERGGYTEGDMSAHSRFSRGPWQNLSSYGIAIVERETLRIEKAPRIAACGPPRGSLDEQLAALRMAREVMSRLDSGTLIDKVSQPVLWHADLHRGNIYVSNEDPRKIVSLIDWQSITVAPIFLQARFPEFLSVDEDFVLDSEMPTLPPHYDQMNADDKEIADFKLLQAKLAKAYEVTSAVYNNRAYKALFLPQFLRELFVRSGEVSEEGEVPLRACLIEVYLAWNDIGFTGSFPFSFTDEDIQKHEDQFQEYRNFHRVQEIARKFLDTDSEGWISPRLDFATKQRQNRDLLQLIMSRSKEYNMSPEEVRKIWPFVRDS
ncbi:hypothetical protein CC80DRAFT_435048 [Byssothecium circinans]|uniref:Altered inheritance of mitochondria protein 9, mitochondrial n=1 Tax=Byssothecium circinans TaxID=147558 RepID=A0A6A5UBF0_9PLEO|nr:hypothetical protein CC80DRAFT_435048 [Byssothecium circinans]